MNSNGQQSVPGGSASSRARLYLRIFWIAALFFSIVLGIRFYSLQPREPVYDGKPLSHWLDQIGSDPRHAKDALRVVQAIGTNAIPWLLAELETESLWRYRANRFLDRQGVIRFRFRNPDERRNRAPWGFFALGSEARAAIPSLAERSRERPDMDHLRALAYCGTDAIPFLCDKLTHDQSPGNTALAIRSAVSYGQISVSEAHEFVPALTQLLQSSNAYTTNKAHHTLKVIMEMTAKGPTRVAQ